MIKKIYFAKSNRANPDYVMEVRRKLKETGAEIVEHKGGAYSHHALLGCDLLIVLPDLTTYEKDRYDETRTVLLGKGLANQIAAFYSHKGSYSNISIIWATFSVELYDSETFQPKIKSDFELTTAADIYLNDDEDYINHSIVTIDADNAVLLGGILTIVKSDNISDKVPENGVEVLKGLDYRYLIIGNT